jgi:hypothetical protein
LPQAPSRSNSPIAVTIPPGSVPADPRTPVNDVVPSWANIRKIARARPTSPTRFMMNAFFAAVAAAGRRYQKAMSRNDARPTPSQPT